MEVFRPLIDRIVYENKAMEFNKEYKYKLINMYNDTVTIDNKQQYLSTAVSIFSKSVFNFLEKDDESKILNYEF